MLKCSNGEPRKDIRGRIGGGPYGTIGSPSTMAVKGIMEAFELVFPGRGEVEYRERLKRDAADPFSPAGMVETVLDLMLAGF